MPIMFFFIGILQKENLISMGLGKPELFQVNSSKKVKQWIYVPFWAVTIDNYNVKINMQTAECLFFSDG